MYDTGKIVGGLVLFAAVVTLPTWFAEATGSSGEEPDLVLPRGGGTCVESREFMRERHMDLLVDWRNAVVRRGQRFYVASDGREYEMSLTGTCLGCHTEREQFCDRCHEYAGSAPDCWACHLEPERSAGPSPGAPDVRQED